MPFIFKILKPVDINKTKRIMIKEIEDKLKELKIELENTILIDSYNKKSLNIIIIKREIQACEQDLLRLNNLTELLG